MNERYMEKIYRSPKIIQAMSQMIREMAQRKMSEIMKEEKIIPISSEGRRIQDWLREFVEDLNDGKVRRYMMVYEIHPDQEHPNSCIYISHGTSNVIDLIAMLEYIKMEVSGYHLSSEKLQE